MIAPLDSTGEITLDPKESHHARDVLRLTVGDGVELFNDAGRVATARIVRCDAAGVVVQVEALAPERSLRPSITVAAAVPKGDRADWMIEKLSELSVDRFVPLRAHRSVVLPSGKSKRDRWSRIAIESAKQSRRAGVMRIDELTDLRTALDQDSALTIVLSTEPSATGMIEVCARAVRDNAEELVLLIGPEGGWSDEELAWFVERGLTRARLTETILRVETAAVAAATIACTCRADAPKSGS